MKLSEMNADQLADALCEIAEPLGNIASDEESNAIIKKFAKPGITRFEQIVVMTTQLIPLILKKHKPDTFVILAFLSERTVEDCKAMNGLELGKECRAYFSDKKLLDFFKPAVTTKLKK